MSTIIASNLQASGGTGTAATLASINGGPIAGARNRVINGAMAISQRGTSFTANGYTLDRWAVYNSGGTFTLTQQTAASGSQPENGMPNFLRIARTSPSGILYLYQRIEDVSLYDGFTVTVSFYAKANTNITLPVRLTQDFGSGGSTAVTVGTVNTNVTSSWAKYTANFTLPSLSGKTIGTSSFLELTFDTPATYSTLDITGVQLEAGTVATPFERRLYGQELSLCQRYFCKPNGGAASFYSRSHGYDLSNGRGPFYVPPPVTMRTTPSVTVSNQNIVNDPGVSFGYGANIVAGSDSSGLLIVLTLTFTSQPPGGSFASAYCQFTASAEL